MLVLSYNNNWFLDAQMSSGLIWGRPWDGVVGWVEEDFCWLQRIFIMYKPGETPSFEWQSGRVIAKAWEASERLSVTVDFQQGTRAVKLAFAPDHGAERALFSFK